MINIYDQGKLLGSVELRNGRMVTKGNVKDLVDHMRYFGGRELSDAEVYQTLPHRLKDRIAANVTNDEKALLDPAFFNGLKKEAAPRREAEAARQLKAMQAWANPSKVVPNEEMLGYASGGPVVGRLHARTGGRTDNLQIEVPAGAYVIPADVVAGLGEGNTEAGAAILEQQFPHEASPGSEPVEILAAGGEFVISPEGVAAVGGGDIKKGHDILDAFVKRARAEQIKTLKGLPGPER